MQRTFHRKIIRLSKFKSQRLTTNMSFTIISIWKTVMHACKMLGVNPPLVIMVYVFVPSPFFNSWPTTHQEFKSNFQMPDFHNNTCSQQQIHERTVNLHNARPVSVSLTDKIFTKELIHLHNKLQINCKKTTCPHLMLPTLVGLRWAAKQK